MRCVLVHINSVLRSPVPFLGAESCSPFAIQPSRSPIADSSIHWYNCTTIRHTHFRSLQPSLPIAALTRCARHHHCTRHSPKRAMHSMSLIICSALLLFTASSKAAEPITAAAAPAAQHNQHHPHTDHQQRRRLLWCVAAAANPTANVTVAGTRAGIPLQRLPVCKCVRTQQKGGSASSSSGGAPCLAPAAAAAKAAFDLVGGAPWLFGRGWGAGH